MKCAASTERPNGDDAIDFLKRLRAPPWLLIAIVPAPSDAITAISAADAGEARDFIARHDGTRNIYYALNPTRTALARKPRKDDISAIEFIHADLDPAPGETPKTAKARYRAALDELEPTAVIDSGNGIQGLWRLRKPIKLNGTGDKAIADAETRMRNLMLALGGKPGTQNIDRILRLPGTTNLPTVAKIKAGRVSCRSRLLQFNDTTHDIATFPDESPESTAGVVPKGENGASDDGADELARTIDDGGGDRHGPTRSEAVWWVINEMLRRGYLKERIVATLTDRGNGISAHVYEQAESAERFAARQVKKATQAITLATGEDGLPHKTVSNVNIALLKMGARLRYDQFADRMLIEGLDGFGPVLDDAAVRRLWFEINRRFKFQPTLNFLHHVVADTVLTNAFHPVRDYLDGLRWDGVERLDGWLTTYAGAKDDAYTRAVGALMLTAAVRRVRRPGVKFDEMVVLESPTQGIGKSTALAVLAVREEWFSDDLPLNVRGKEVIETLRGKWIVEAAELAGMRRADIEHVKALLARQWDRGRMAYDRMTSEVPRQCVFVATTNDSEYLKDTSGNRRFWPVRVVRLDLEALRRDRDQLWAEAATREASGIDIRLARDLWAVAAEAQAQRLTNDPWRDALAEAIAERIGKISSASLWVILDVKISQRQQAQALRVGKAMRELGWKRANTNGTIKSGGKLVSGWVKGKLLMNGRRRELVADRITGTLIVEYREG